MAFYGKYALAAFAAAVAVSSTAAAQSDWTSRVSFNGNFTYRLQRDVNMCYTGTVAAGTCITSDNTYQRYSFRLGVVGKVNDSLSVVASLKTGEVQSSSWDNAGQGVTTPSGTSSTTYTGFGQRGTILLDNIFFDYKLSDSLGLQLGRYNVPFWTPGNVWWIWNIPNLLLEGLAVKWNGDMGSMKPFAILNTSVILDRVNGVQLDTSETVGADVGLLAAQVGAKMKTDSMWLTGAVGYYQYNNTKGLQITTAGSPNAAGSARGNTTETVGGKTVFKYEYKILDVGVEYGMNLGFAPVSVYANYAQNSDPGDDNKGMLAGVKVGELKDVGSWSVNYNYRDTRKDAFWGNSGDSAFLINASTDSFGSILNLGYQAWPNAALSYEFETGKKTVSTLGGTNFEIHFIQLAAKF